MMLIKYHSIAGKKKITKYFIDSGMDSGQTMKIFVRRDIKEII